MEILLHYPICAVELGIQSMDDRVLAACRRGHAAADTVQACALLRNAEIPFVGQMMTGLPGSDGQSEIETAKRICSMGASGARLYPCIVFQNTALADMTRKGLYSPLSVEEAVARSAAALEIFDTHGVPCLKIGLHDGQGLHDPDTYFAGPHHPALGEMVPCCRRWDRYGKNTLKFLSHRDVPPWLSDRKRKTNCVFWKKQGQNL